MVKDRIIPQKPCVIVKMPKDSSMSLSPMKIPDNAFPTVIQPDKKTAEAEAKRLSNVFNDYFFLVFELSSSTITESPTVITRFQ
jgi:hypothetical protein